MTIVQEIEKRFLPLLKEAAAELQMQFPDFKIHVESSSIGSLTAYQGHSIYVDCLLPDAPDNRPDNIALGIGVMHITTLPMLCEADVCWGAGGGFELDLMEEPVPYSSEALNRIEAELPRLIDALRTALRRGHPMD